MHLDLVEFRGAQFSRFVQHLLRHTDLTYVVQQTCVVDHILFFFVFTHTSGNLKCIIRHSLGMTAGITVFCIDRKCKSLNDIGIKFLDPQVILMFFLSQTYQPPVG